MQTINDSLITDDQAYNTYFSAKLSELKRNPLSWAVQVVSTLGSLGRLLSYVTVFTVVFSTLFLMVAFLIQGNTPIVWTELQGSLQMVLMVSMIISTMGCMAVNIGKFKSTVHSEARLYATDAMAITQNRHYIEQIIEEKLKTHRLNSDPRPPQNA